MRIVCDEKVGLAITEQDGSMKITGFGAEPKKHADDQSAYLPNLVHHLQASRSKLLKASKAVADWLGDYPATAEQDFEAAYEELKRCIAEIEGE